MLHHPASFDGDTINFVVSELTPDEYEDLRAYCHMSRVKLRARYDLDRSGMMVRVLDCGTNLVVDSIHDQDDIWTLERWKPVVTVALDVFRESRR